MPLQAIAGRVPDPDLPTLSFALDLEQMRPYVVAAVSADHLEQPELSARILAHKAGKRATIHYTLDDGASGEPRLEVIGKVYRTAHQAERAYRRADELARDVFADSRLLSSPMALLLVADRGLVLQGHVAGHELRAALGSEDEASALAQAARWLAVLHAATPLAGLKLRNTDYDLRKALKWCDEVAERDLPDVAPAARTVRRRLEAVQPIVREPRMIHKDYYYANLIWDGTRCSAVDFDQMCLGDPALDVGHFIAHLDFLSIRNAKREGVLTNQGSLFLSAYRAAAAPDIARDLDARLPFYRAYTFLKLAATEVRRHRRAWRRHASVLVDLALSALSREDRSALT